MATNGETPRRAGVRTATALRAPAQDNRDASIAFLDFDQLVGHQAMGFATDTLGRFLVGGLNQIGRISLKSPNRGDDQCAEVA
jgi:hypothetical protein